VSQGSSLRRDQVGYVAEMWLRVSGVINVLSTNRLGNLARCAHGFVVKSNFFAFMEKIHADLWLNYGVPSQTLWHIHHMVLLGGRKTYLNHRSMAIFNLLAKPPPSSHFRF
jgi:hypothetical protein